jgi:sigma-B regulation protein RsbU (phosphoserine phosphatase)
VADKVNARSIGFLRRVKKYATVNLVLFGGSDIRYVCGGGNGLLIHRGDRFSFARRDSFLGLRERPFREHVLPFEQGDLLAMYTDGIVEAQDGAERDYTIRRLNSLIAGNADRPVPEILDVCLRDFRGFSAHTHDDVTLMIMRKKVDERC